MKQYSAKNIFNIALAGHSGSGKTSLAEAMLYLGGGSDRLGKVSEGNTVCDFDPEEIKRKTSVQACVAPVEWKGKKLNIIDAPGLFDFEGGLYEAARAADTVLITVSGKDGVCVGTEKAVKAADKLSAYLKCIEERRAGNDEFLSAEKQTRKTLEESPLPEVHYFLEHFVPAFELTLDELGTIDTL